jgi:Fic family protein
VKSFANGKLKDFRLANGLAKLLVDCEREHGAEAVLPNADSAVLNILRHHSIITSSEASCAIEGIILSPDRKEAVLELSDTPRNRDETEVQNYRRTLEFIYNTQPRALEVTSQFIQLLHSMAMDGAADAGEWKTRPNYITEESAGRKRVRFVPLLPELVPDAVEQLCIEYNDILQEGGAPQLVAISALAFDVTAIHPFRDGNGRVSRLLTTAAMIGQGYELPKYISLEELIQERKEGYYKALEQSSEGWHTGNHDIEPFIRFQVETIMLGYKELAERRERVMDPVSVTLSPTLDDNIAQAVKAEFLCIYPNAAFSKRELRAGMVAAIDGLVADLPENEWERMNRAKKLIDSLIVRATRKAAG